MDFKQRLISSPPRDRSGPRSSDRFVYQQSWALCELLTLHESQSDYVVTFDHHEDVSVMNSEENPTEIRGFQIKTKDSGNWTIAAITKQEPGSGEEPSPLPSILGKLYTLKKQFPAETKLLQFVSNAPVSVKLKIDGKTHRDQCHTVFLELDDSVQSEVRENLQKELKLAELPTLESLLEFDVAEVPLRGHDTHTKGRLTEFLEALHPDRPFHIVPIYRALLSEVAVRNNNQEQITSYEDLIRMKSISRRQFEKLLGIVGVSRPELKWETVENRLNAEHAPLALVRGLRREWDAVSLDRLAVANVIQLRLKEIIEKSCSQNAGIPRLVDYLEAVYQEIASEVKSTWAFSPMYIKAAIVMSIYNEYQ